MAAQTFQLLVDGVPYVVKAIPFEFRTETRFQVSFNGSEDYIFYYDHELRRYVSLGSETATIPASLEDAIATKLQSLA